ncbi:ABC transporter substrate-binding protein [Marinomonas sp. 15G1-11]|uniref:ABC transporter substrate-binding protein n=1 Tax=Marinomonas phaeophyticola TaxID=3004091 RepID=A0ABT4JY90_9GAMM|nr:ABC transporter substrate-binding protein [Marinomonas sp. 15G1-11]MCZ2722748.1 ABC transporter substrate-binding protein [Marinomonas sp. 15G1-11]
MKNIAFLLITFNLWITSLGVQAASLSMAFDADPVSLDPHEQLSEATLQLSHLVFDPLLRRNQSGIFEPRLASHWEQINPLTLRVYLREGVRFHSGNMLSADDIIFTILRLKRSPDFRAMFNAIAGVKKIDALTVDISMHQQTPLILNILTYVFPMDSAFYKGRDAIVKFGETFASKNMSGTGPYILTQREPGVELIFKRFHKYWDHESKGNVDTIKFTPIRSDSTRLAALLSGDVDFIHPISPIDIPRIKRSPDIKFVSMPSTRILLLHMNQARRIEFRDQRVREAINLAINQSLIVEKILKGFGKAAGQLSVEQFSGHVKEIKPKYNLEKAKQLMKNAGYGEGFRISMMAPNNRYVNDEKISQAVVAMLAKINISVELKTLPKAQYFQEFDNRSADLMMIGWQSDTNDSNNLFEFLIACTDQNTGLGAYNASSYCNAKIDDRIRAANIEMNAERRTQLLQEIEIILEEESAIVPLLWQSLSWGAKQNFKIENIVNERNFPYLGDLVVE